jgi:hypothetical protein
MSALLALIACTGTWQGTNVLQDPETNLPEESSASALVTPVLGGRFVRVDYTWGYRGTPQAGSLLIGYDAKASIVSAYWIDAWHNGDKGMLCQGAFATNGEITVRGSYAAPPGPDWGWRTVITPNGGTALRIVMYNIWPDGKAELAVEANYAR